MYKRQAFCYIVHAGLDSRGIGKGYPRGNRERRVAKRVLVENTEAYLRVHLIPDSLGVSFSDPSGIQTGVNDITESYASWRCV